MTEIQALNLSDKSRRSLLRNGIDQIEQIERRGLENLTTLPSVGKVRAAGIRGAIEGWRSAAKCKKCKAKLPASAEVVVYCLQCGHKNRRAG